MNWIQKNALYFAWSLSLFGLLLSLFVSEIERIEPCHLCWYQRIALFPLVIFLGMATYKNDLKMIPYALPLVFIGGFIALYQAVGQKIPFLLSSATCGFADDCVIPVFTLFGFITFPFISFVGFAVIGGLLYMAQKNR